MDTPPAPPSTPPASSEIEPPKKYVRTFASDMEALKRGGAPDLKQFEKPASVFSSSTVHQAPPPTPALIPSPPAPAPLPSSVPKPEPSPMQSHPLQTYAGDFSQRMKETHASTATVLAAEQDSLSEVTQVPPDRFSRANILYAVAGVALLLIGGIGTYIAYTRYLGKMQTAIVEPTAFAPIFVDEREKISATKTTEVSQAITQSVTRSLAPNAVRLLYADSASAPDIGVFSSLEFSAPGALVRNVDASRSMAGVVNAGGNQSPFFILSVASYSDTFAGMLSWERSMPRDLTAIFPPYPAEISATTTAPAIIPAPVPTFRDEVVANHDVRVFRDDKGRSILLYGYWNQTTLVIARDSSAFGEILARLATARAQ